MSELNALVVSGAAEDRKLVGEILRPYVQLDKENCEIRPTGEWAKLSPEKKILVYLVARKTMVVLDDFDLSVESAKAGEVVQATGVKSGTAYPILRKLLTEDSLIEQLKDKTYRVPNHAIPKVKDMLSKAKTNKEENG